MTVGPCVAPAGSMLLGEPPGHRKTVSFGTDRALVILRREDSLHPVSFLCVLVTITVIFVKFTCECLPRNTHFHFTIIG